VRAFELKLSQGAKPGKGGILPGSKVTAEIAAIRGIPEGEDAISPNRHQEISNPDELLDVIERVRRITGKPVGMKTVIGSEIYPQQLVAAILRRGVVSAPDFITLDGGEGGSGAAPQALADHVGLSLSESLPLLVDVLYQAGSAGADSDHRLGQAGDLRPGRLGALCRCRFCRQCAGVSILTGLHPVAAVSSE
jgi:glutamate synthase domain-containing protein 2